MKNLKAIALTALTLLLSSTPGRAEIINQSCLEVGFSRVCDIYDDGVPGSFGRSFIEYGDPTYGVYVLTSVFDSDEVFVLIAEETGEYFSVTFNNQGEILEEEGNQELLKRYHLVVGRLIDSMFE